MQKGIPPSEVCFLKSDATLYYENYIKTRNYNRVSANLFKESKKISPLQEKFRLNPIKSITANRKLNPASIEVRGMQRT